MGKPWKMHQERVARKVKSREHRVKEDPTAVSETSETNITVELRHHLL